MVGIVAITGAKMDAATCTELKTEPALAKRWLRTDLLPLPVWQWLCGRNVSLRDRLPAPSPLLMNSIEAFAQPLGSHSNSHERQALDDCLTSAAQLITFCHQQARGPALACQQRMLAASLLPLYRGLACGSVAEVTSVLRRQLADALSVIAALAEFREELAELLGTAMADDQSPYAKFKDGLQVELEQLTQVMLTVATKWDGSDKSQLDSLVREEIKLDWRPAWGQPAVLWRLAGELIAQRAEFVVPRDWIDVPVPWSEASEHWLDIVHALEQTPSLMPVAATTSSTATPVNAQHCTTDTPAANNAAKQASLPALDKPRIDQSLSSAAHAPISASGNSLSTDNASSADQKSNAATADSAIGEDIQRLKLEIEIADTVDSLVQATRQATGNAVGNRTDGSHPPQSPRPRSEEFVVPKIIIAEVRSHNDPAFVSVVRRQLGLCRSEERCMSLLAVKVSPDGEEGNMPTLQSLGLASWQQKLVNWMSDHPEIRDPYAFVSNEGELILSLMDMERNTATLILRQGLNAVLASTSEEPVALSRAAVPARYHCGIGSVSSPTANFEPEQLIEATYRCLDAATRHGKASIKSIEVF